MAPARHSVLALLGLAISIRAAPTGLQDRQIGLTSPQQSVSWDTGNPEPTEEPSGPGLPPIFPPQPSEQISLSPPSYSVSWDGAGPSEAPASSKVPPYPLPPKSSGQVTVGPSSYSVSWALESSTATPDEPEKPTLPPYTPPKPSDQISLGKPSYWVSWETSGPSPTAAPEEPEYPPPSKPTNEFSLGQPSGWISWETSGPGPTAEPEEPEYPPSKPSDQISLGPPSYSVTWDGSGPGASSTTKPESTPKPEPPKSSTSPIPSPPKSTKEPGYPPWNPWPPKSTKSTAKTTPKSTPKSSQQPTSTPQYSPKPTSTPKPTPTPTPTPTPPKETDQISLGPPKYSVSWNLEKRQDTIDLNVKPTSKAPLKSTSTTTTKPKPKPTSKKPKPSSTPKPTPTPTPTPTPSPPQQSDEITIGPPQYSISWAKKRQFDYDPEATAEPFPEDEEPFPEDPEDEGPIEIPPFPFPTQPNSIGIQPPKVSFGWGKREAAPQTEHDTIGLQFPRPTIWWPKPQPPTYVSWGKRQDEAEPTALPEDPEFPEDPEDPEETGPIEIPPFPIPTPPNSIGLEPPKQSVGWGKREAAPETDTIGLQFPTFSFYWPKPSPPTYISWGKRQDEEEPTEMPAPPAPTPSDEVVIQPPQASISWAKRDEYSHYSKPSKPTPTPAPSSKSPVSSKPSHTTTPQYTPIPPGTPIKSPPAGPSHTSCPDVTAIVTPTCVPPQCPKSDVACDFNLRVPVMEKRVKGREIEKTIVTIKTAGSLIGGTPTTPIVGDGCTTAKTKTVTRACPTYTCVPWCDPAQVVR
ncbi:Nn.00g036700.m01.CDS01 [Neocucurbitaria sp. VM-36]